MMPDHAPSKKNNIGLALGGGAARGWAHLGVLDALAEFDIRPDIVCGTSIGALVGAAYVSGRVGALKEWVLTLTRGDIVSMLDVNLRGGLIRGDRVVQYCEEHFFASDFDSVEKPFACVATDLANGREVWLREGRLADAVRASIALPGLFSPARYQGKNLVDGGLVNPVPVSLCRAMGADIVIAVDLSAGIVGRRLRSNGENHWAHKFREMVGWSESEEPLPSLIDVVVNSINIMQVSIARSRQSGDPPEVMIAPAIGHITAMEFERAEEGILEGRRAVEKQAELLREALR